MFENINSMITSENEANIHLTPFPIFHLLGNLSFWIDKFLDEIKNRNLVPELLWDINYIEAEYETYTLEMKRLVEKSQDRPPNAFMVGKNAEGKEELCCVLVCGSEKETDCLIEKMDEHNAFRIKLNRIIETNLAREEIQILTGVDVGGDAKHFVLAPTPELLAVRAKWKELIENPSETIISPEKGLYFACFKAKKSKEENKETFDTIMKDILSKIDKKPFIFQLIDPLKKKMPIEEPFIGWAFEKDTKQKVFQNEVLTLGAIDVGHYLDAYMAVLKKHNITFELNKDQALQSLQILSTYHGLPLTINFANALLSIAYEGHSLKEEAYIKAKSDIKNTFEIG